MLLQAGERNSADLLLGRDGFAFNFTGSTEGQVEFQTEVKKIRASIGGTAVIGFLEQPLEDHDTTINVIFPGLFGPASSYRRFSHALARRGLEVLVVSSPSSQGLIRDLHPSSFTEPERLHIDSGEALLDEIDAEKFREFGHSWGGTHAIGLALRRPEQTKSVVLFGSSALFPHKRRELARRSPGFTVNEGREFALQTLAEGDFEVVKDGVECALSNLGRVLAETWRAGSGRRLMPQVLRLESSGVQSYALLPEEDSLFLTRRVIPYIEGVLGYEIVPDANHLAPQLQPELTAEAFVRTFHKLEDVLPLAS
ncbi:MAG TPA: alpha/beta hydrolase [Candidatus Saccharimonadales bacterium]|nr:alpha/beta hydrolase [Candidatus Saccharimonadales bacterium]